MSDDDRFDAVLKRLAADEYNRPPEIIPREAMWEAVRAGLGPKDEGRVAADEGRGTWEEVRVAGLGAPDSGPGGEVRRLPAADRARGTRRWFYLAAAAVLLLAAGIQIGRMMGPASPQIARDARPATGRPDSLGSGAAPRDSAGVGAPADPAPDPQPDRQVATAAPRSDDGPPRPRPGPERALAPELGDGQYTAVYTAAAVQHFAEAEAMLIAFKGDLGRGRLDAQLSSWARDLLSTTRLLIDSPAANDPLRRKLFHDLELVLVQIIQLSPGAPARDRDLIEGALTDDQVLTRLRTAIPLVQRGT